MAKPNSHLALVLLASTTFAACGESTAPHSSTLPPGSTVKATPQQIEEATVLGAPIPPARIGDSQCWACVTDHCPATAACRANALCNGILECLASCTLGEDCDAKCPYKADGDVADLIDSFQACQTSFTGSDGVCRATCLAEGSVSCTDSDCLPGQVCRSVIEGAPAACTRQSGVGEPCTGSNECQDTLGCSGTQNVCLPAATLTCTDSTGCAWSDSCYDGLCYSFIACDHDDDCPTGRICEDNECRPGFRCTDDSQCVAGQVCEVDSGDCVTANSQACTTNLDCPSGEMCTDGACVGTCYPLCMSDDQCQNFEACVAGVCTPPEKQCNDDSECSFECRFGRCVDSAYACWIDEDCGDGNACIGGECWTTDVGCH
jgi:hypothetical protein